MSDKILLSEIEGLPSLNEDIMACREPRRKLRTMNIKALSLPVDHKARKGLEVKSDKITDDYHIMNKIGFGTYSQVKKGINRRTEQRVAIKICKGTSACKYLENEAEILKLVDSEYIPKFYDFKQDKVTGKAYLVMEYIEGQPLDEFINEHGTMSAEEAEEYLIMLIKAVHCLHSKGIAHRDIKPQNILITKDKKLKLIDFNISKKMKQRGSSSQGKAQKFNCRYFTQISSPMYAAPEVFSRDCYTESIDIWGIGVAYAEMLFKISAFA